jgi:virulence factor
VRVGVIGLGGIARKAYLPLLTCLEGVELMFCSRTAATVARLQSQYRVPLGATSLEQLLAWRPEAALVLTPSSDHKAIVSRLLRAGVDVFVEKPATMCSADTRELAELADELGRVLMVGFNRRYAPLHQKARAVWGDRPVTLCVLEKQRVSPLHVDLSHQYVDDTIHLIDLLRWFCGEATAVQTVHQVCDARLVSAASTLRLLGGGCGVVATSLQSGQWSERYTVHGGGASLYVEAFTCVRLIDAEGEHRWEASQGSWTRMLEQRGFAGQVARFFDCVRTRQQPETSAWEAWRTQCLQEELVSRDGE